MLFLEKKSKNIDWSINWDFKAYIHAILCKECIFTHPHLQIHILVYTCTHPHTCSHISIRAHTHICIHTYTYTRIHTCPLKELKLNKTKQNKTTFWEVKLLSCPLLKGFSFILYQLKIEDNFFIHVNIILGMKVR